MRSNTAVREVTDSGILTSADFGISTKDSAHIMSILRDTLYSDRVLAVLREYGSNAWDAHRMAGKPDVPIHVTIPTHDNLSLVIRDFGPGIAHADVFGIFTQYGASTKRNSDDVIGNLGIGCKSGFAYSEMFTVTSWHDGVKRVYVAVLDESDAGQLKLLSESPFEAGDEPGLQIEIPVQPNDVTTFRNRAEKLFRYFVPRPVINIPLPTVLQGKTFPNGALIEDRYVGWTAVMGCVPYKLNIDQLRGTPGFTEKYVSQISGVLYFNIGEIAMAASREELKYNDQTKLALVTKLNGLIEQYIEHESKTILDPNKQWWERRLAVREIALRGVQSLSLVAPDLYQTYITIPSSDRYRLLESGWNGVYTRTNTIRVERDRKVYIHDDPSKAIKGYFDNLDHGSLVLELVGDDRAASLAAWNEMLETTKLTGIPILPLSVHGTWVPPAARAKVNRTYNPKYTAKRFTYKGTNDGTTPSNNWEKTTVDPTPTDVYVDIRQFRVHNSFHWDWANAVKLCDLLKIPMPTIYAYKVGDTTDRVGVKFNDWYSSLVKRAASDPYIIGLVKMSVWRFKYRYNRTKNPLADKLDPNHTIAKFLKEVASSILNYTDSPYAKIPDSVLRLINRDQMELEHDQEVETILSDYPMLTYNQGINALWPGDARETDVVLEYINLVDAARAAKQAVATQPGV